MCLKKCQRAEKKNLKRVFAFTGINLPLLSHVSNFLIIPHLRYGQTMTTHTDPHTAIRDIDLLTEPFKSKVKDWLAACPQIAVHETLRTQARQDYLRSIGRSWVQRSNHQDGIAVDVHFKAEPHFPPSGDAKWTEIITKAKTYGIDSGYTLWGTDTVHFQDDGTPYQSDNQSSATLPADVVQVIQDTIMQNSQLWHSLSDAKDEIDAMQHSLHSTNNALRESIK